MDFLAKVSLSFNRQEAKNGNDREKRRADWLGSVGVLFKAGTGKQELVS